MNCKLNEWRKLIWMWKQRLWNRNEFGNCSWCSQCKQHDHTQLHRLESISLITVLTLYLNAHPMLALSNFLSRFAHFSISIHRTSACRIISHNFYFAISIFHTFRFSNFCFFFCDCHHVRMQFVYFMTHILNITKSFFFQFNFVRQAFQSDSDTKR